MWAGEEKEEKEEGRDERIILISKDIRDVEVQSSVMCSAS